MWPADGQTFGGCKIEHVAEIGSRLVNDQLGAVRLSVAELVQMVVTVAVGRLERHHANAVVLDSTLRVAVELIQSPDQQTRGGCGQRIMSGAPLDDGGGRRHAFQR